MCIACCAKHFAVRLARTALEVTQVTARVKRERERERKSEKFALS
jgi:hypothetical protein